MKIYQKPITEINYPELEQPILAGTSMDDADGPIIFEGLPIDGSSLSTPSFGLKLKRRRSIWAEEEDE